MQLHRESVDNLHTAIDANVKVGMLSCVRTPLHSFVFVLQGMYTFMTKFEELHRSFTPMKQLSEQMYPEPEKFCGRKELPLSMQ